MKTILSLGVLATGLFVGAERSESLVARYSAEQEIRHENVLEMSAEWGDMTVSINGQELPSEALEAMRAEMPGAGENTERVVSITLVKQAEDGVPTRVRRYWESIEREDSREEADEWKGSPLEERALLLSVDEDEVVAEIDDDGATIDDEFLAHHQLEFACDALLPKGEVSVGETWKLDDAQTAIVLGFARGPEIFGSEDEEGDDPFEELLREAADESLEVTFEAYEDHAGERCAVLTFAGTVAVESDDPGAIFGESEDGQQGSMVLEMEFEGRVLFDIEAGRVVELHQEFEGTLDMIMEMTEEMEGTELLIEMNVRMNLKGSEHDTWS